MKTITTTKARENFYKLIDETSTAVQNKIVNLHYRTNWTDSYPKDKVSPPLLKQIQLF